ncbi:hypothetical protein OKW21_000749 [Catalinimonas alkaloidigena]|uniref:hypothetical protein n=1 Tax=Catalinimonas alkaloidigena TaxID=1075417 RepID=UPI0024069FCA|nr:hypothetical protein [Catalinimonas alkaloidigena]MDF9795486.1 hypothetical protein [Catalinimonas alkaloidigena]
MLLLKLISWQISVNSILLYVCFPLFSFAQPSPDKTATTGDWDNDLTWIPSGKPGVGDVILIPAGETVTVRGTDHILNDAVMIIEGDLVMESACPACADYSSLTFNGENSGVIIEDGGQVIDGTALGGDTHFIAVQGETVWSGDNCLSNCGDIEGDYTSTGTATSIPPALSSLLPVELIHFSGHYQNRSVYLEWTTASETNNSHFVIERAIDDFEFEIIGEMQGAGNSLSEIEYIFEDQQVSSDKESTFYYRLRQEDYDGQHKYSKNIAVFNEISGVLNVWPTSFTDHIDISINSMTTESLELKIYDVKGNILVLNVYEIIKGKNILEVKDLEVLSKGICFLNMGSKNLQYKRKLIKH